MFFLIGRLKAALATLVERVETLAGTFSELNDAVREQGRLDGPAPRLEAKNGKAKVKAEAES